MGAIRIMDFGGIIPRMGDRALPDENAQYSLNSKLLSRELRAWWQPKVLATIVSPANPLDFYFFQYLGNDYYVGFTGLTDVVRAALVNDAFSRIYYTNSIGAWVTTMPDMIAAVAASRLGVPAPTFSTFTVTPSGGTVATAETRIYTAILVSKYGEEGSNSVTVTANGNADGTWTVAGLNTFIYNSGTYPNITKIRLYRTITSSTSVDYRQVQEWTLGTAPASYADVVSAVTLASSPKLQSITWTTPPDGLQGLVNLGGGFSAGFVGSTVYFSEPYYPHAWPQQYQQAVGDTIVALGAYGNTLVITTVGRPHAAVGTTPDAMSFTKLEASLPNSARRSIVSTAASVFYSAPDGLVSVSDNGIEIASKPYATKDEWNSVYNTAAMNSVSYGDRYLSFYSPTLGFIIGFEDASTAFTELQFSSVGIVAAHNDRFTGKTMIMDGAGVISEWDGTVGVAMTYTWRSKKFLVPKPANFGAAQVHGDFITPVVTYVPPSVGTVNLHALNHDYMNEGTLNGRISGTPTPDATASASFKLYCDSALVYSTTVTSESPFRLPSGIKGTQFEVEVSSTVSIFSIVVASTLKELEKVP